MSARPFTIADLAVRTGHSVDWFYRRGNLESLYAEGLPEPIAGHGHKRWERSGVEAWLLRHHPAAPLTAANDAVPVPEPQTAGAWRKHLHEAYR